MIIDSPISGLAKLFLRRNSYEDKSQNRAVAGRFVFDFIRPLRFCPYRCYSRTGTRAYSTDDLTVVDVREPSEYSDTRGHIPGALNYPWNSGVLEAQYGELPIDGPILVVCRSGGRSNQAANFLDSKGFSMVYDMQGGMSAWKWETELCVDVDEKYGGGTGEPNDPYLIYTTEHMNAIGAEPNDWDKHFKLMADIDLSGYSYDRALIAPDMNTSELGIQGTPFTGIFDGNGQTISDLTIAGGYYLGLFGYVGREGEIKDVGVVDANITGTGTYVGSLVGYLSYGNIVRCYAEGDTVHGHGTVGGLVGRIQWGTITNCHSSTNVSGGNDVAGLVGQNYGGALANCYSTGSAIGDQWIGGLVGRNGFYGEIVNCYAAGNITGNKYVGGLVGINPHRESSLGWIRNCYSVGRVTGSAYVGGLVGSNSGGVEFSFWDIETSGQDWSDGGTGKTTAEMQTASTFLEAGWDFVDENTNGTEDIWSICEGTNYPGFVWQIPVGDFVCPDGITIDDFMFFMEHWLDDNCDSSNNYCEGTDLDLSGSIDVNDLEILFENWSGE